MRAILLTTLLAFGCGEPVPKERPPADHGVRPDVASDPLGAQLWSMGQERVPRMDLEGGTLRGTLRAGEVEDHLVVLIGTHCYAFMGVGGDGVRDLDIILLDPSGTPVMHDTDQGREATLGVRERICPQLPGSYEIRVRMFSGGGDYVVQAYKFQII